MAEGLPCLRALWGTRGGRWWDLARLWDSGITTTSWVRASHQPVGLCHPQRGGWGTCHPLPCARALAWWASFGGCRPPGLPAPGGWPSGTPERQWGKQVCVSSDAWHSGLLAGRRSTQLTGNWSLALVERDRECFMALREHWCLLCPHIMFTGCCPDWPHWIVTLTCASQDTSAYFCPLYPCAPVSHWSRRCLCDSSDFVMSLVTTGPWSGLA